VGLSVVAQADETDTNLNIFQKLDKWVYFNDPFGNGRISFEDKGAEVSGGICFPPDFKKCGGFKGVRQ